MKIKLITLNIHKGATGTRPDETLSLIKSNIQRERADIVCLQEVLGSHAERAVKPQFEFLADEVWSHYAYGKNAVYSQGHHGNAILSHFPIVESENFDISNHTLERRGVLHAVVARPEAPNSRLHIMTLHLDLTGWGRERQLHNVRALIEERVKGDEPLILCGDFNDWREKSSCLLRPLNLVEAHFQQHNRYAKTFPARWPMLKLDRIYTRHLKVLHAGALANGNWRQLSDHLPVAAELEW
jgi:endonuclease/exonuclease/phosphatase family metal-dependent hydrolase